MKSFLQELRKKCVIGIVGGSDLPKQEEQMGGGSGELDCDDNVTDHCIA